MEELLPLVLGKRSRPPSGVTSSGLLLDIIFDFVITN